MKATDVIRGVLDLIDKIDCQDQDDKLVAILPEPEQIQTGVDTNRFKHIFAMLDAERNNPPMYDNSPNEVITGIDAVTKDAGGGWNGPKNPADLKGNSISLFPGFQAMKE
jgi:hypothetical protein